MAEAWDPYADFDIDATISGKWQQGLTQDIKIPDIPGLEKFDPEDLKKLFGKLEVELVWGPWKKVEKCQPFLGWHTPTCTEDDWRHEDVKMELGQGIMYLTLNRPEQRNSLNDTIFEALCDAVFILNRRIDLRAVVITGTGKFFCGGDDEDALACKAGIKQAEAGDGSKGNRLEYAAPAPEVQYTLYTLGEAAKKVGAFPTGQVDYDQVKRMFFWQTLTRVPQITFALVQGAVVGSGMGLAACSDIIMSYKSAYYLVEDLKNGFVPGMALPYIQAKMGVSSMKQMLILGQSLSTEQMKFLGFVQEVVEGNEDAHDQIFTICKSVTACGPRSVEAAKELVSGVAGRPITQTIQFYTAALLAMVTVSEEAKIGMIRLQERKPKPWEEQDTMIMPLYGKEIL